MSAPPAPLGRRRNWWPAAAIFVASQALYLLTLHRGLPPLDSAEFIAVAGMKGGAPARGAPLLTVLGILFSKLPFGSLEARVNYLSALCGSVALTLGYLACLELTGEAVASLAAASMLGVSIMF